MSDSFVIYIQIYYNRFQCWNTVFYLGRQLEMELQRLLSLTRKAVDDYQMIQEGDKIAVGISGGKDSLTLLYAMANLRRFYPKKFSLIAIYGRPGLWRLWSDTGKTIMWTFTGWISYRFHWNRKNHFQW